jgi:hypothetical protein
MTDVAAEPGQALATQPLRPVREVRVVESSNPIMSTAGFEHLIRVARIMAESGMMSETLTHEGIGSNKKALPNEVVLARAFIIGELASRIDESPISVMQCASFVHGKLMLEGKFVDAMLTSKFSIKTQKDYGKWDPVQEKTVLGEEGVGDQLGIVVSAMVNGRREEVHGYVGGWKTSGNNSPWKPGSMRKMLGNRGVREFARAHEAGAILGIIGIVGDDEFDQDEVAPQLAPPPQRARAKENVAAKLGAASTSEGDGQARGEGFNQAHVEAETDEKKDLPPHDPETGELREEGGSAEAEEERREPTRPQHGEEYRLDSDEEVQGRFQIYRDGEPIKKVTDPTKFEVYDAHPEPAAQAEEEQVADAEFEEGAALDDFAGHAEPGKKYVLATEPANAEGRYTIYQDGKPFSSCAEAGLSKHAVYRSHPPITETKDDIQEEKADKSPTEAERILHKHLQEIGKMTSWLDVKARCSFLSNKEPVFMNLPLEEQNEIRALIWEVVVRIKKEHRDVVDFATDVTAFRLWMETIEGGEGAAAIEGTFRVLMNQVAFKKLSDGKDDPAKNDQAKLKKYVDQKTEQLRGRK